MIRLFASVAFALAIVSCAPSARDAAAAPITPAKKQPVAATEKPKPPAIKRGKVRTISLTEGFALQQSGKALIYDARPSYLFNQGHLPGAINMPKSICDAVIEVRAPELKAAAAANTPILVYCTGFLCSDARTVANHLASAGYSSSILEGGYDAWKAGELPTE